MFLNPKLPDWITGRLAVLTLTALTHLGEPAFADCGFLYRLLAYCDNPAVYNLFETITTYASDAPLDNLQVWLRSFGLCQYLIRELMGINFFYRSKLENPYLDPVYNRAMHMYELISLGCENPNLRVEFQTAEVVQCLARQFTATPDFVQISRWRAIVSITCPATASVAVAFYAQAVSFLQDGVDRLVEYRVSALSFLAKMIELDDQAFEVILPTHVPQNCLNLVFQFENSTLFHTVFLRFVEVGLRNPEFTNHIVESYIPLAIDRGTNDTNRIIKSTCIGLLELVMCAAKRNKRLDAVLKKHADFCAMKKGPIRAFRSIADSPYGGRIPGSSSFSLLAGVFGT
jgi:hypothetical protein